VVLPFGEPLLIAWLLLKGVKTQSLKPSVVGADRELG